jgi:Icc-related predicted phosphoesterase
MMNITTISDTHGQHDKIDIGSGDMIIHSGDCTPRGTMNDIEEFLRWYGDLEFTHKILVPGNHDWDFEKLPEYCKELCANYGVTMLNDSGVKIQGLNIWGSPVQPEFCNWAFNRTIAEPYATKKHPWIGHHWNKIPEKTDILITHGPAHGILDLTHFDKQKVGCPLLRKKIGEIKPVLHVFGHIHEERGVYIDPSGPTTHVNASSLDVRYRPYPVPSYRFDWNSLITGSSRGDD